MRVAIYARVSTTGQDPEVQLLPLRRYCAERGFEVFQEYVDVGYGGAKCSRPGLDALMEAAAGSSFRLVLVWKFDRFARSVQHLLQALEFFRARGIDFVSLTESIDTTTPIGRMVFTFLGAIAAFERDLLRERTVAGLEKARAAGKHIGRPRISVSADQLIERMAQAREHGKPAGYRKLAKEFGISPASVSRMLREALQKAGDEY